MSHYTFILLSNCNHPTNNIQNRGRFDVLDSNTNIPADPVRVALYNNNESMVWSSNYGDSDGSFSRGGSGRHWLCLENGITYEQQNRWRDHSPRVPRTIGFAIRVKKPTGIIAEMIKREVEDGVHVRDVNDATQNLLELSAALNENFDALYDHMSFMKAREMVHRELHEETFTKVVKWNILEICTVVIVAFGQVLNVWYIMSKRGASTRYY